MSEPHSASQVVPAHLGIILDGNRRWATERRLPSLAGHQRGREVLLELIPEILDRGVSVVTVFLFSTENWRRDEGEVSYLMNLALLMVTKDLAKLKRDKIRLVWLGRRDGLSARLITALEKAEAETSHFTGRSLALCFNYGGQQEIADAVRAMIRAGIEPDDVTPEQLTTHLYHPELPPIDLVVRTSGEQRLSNFMLWRAAYAEFYFTETYWPAMTSDDITAAFEYFRGRQRRFGGN